MDHPRDGIIIEAMNQPPGISQPLTAINLEKPPSIDSGLRNAWQWLAMVTMVADHVGYLYKELEIFRYVGRLAMPLYAMLFVITIRSGHINIRRLLVIAAISQIPYSLLFIDQFYDPALDQIIYDPTLNIIFGFAIFYGLTVAVERRNWLGIVLAVAAMWIPCSYGWYLYISMATFYWLDRRPAARHGVFAVATAAYTYFGFFYNQQVIYWKYLRQLLAIGAPFIRRIRLPRPNKYLYRYFYPGHLLILLVIHVAITGYLTTPFGTFWFTPEPEETYELYDDYYESYESYENPGGHKCPPYLFLLMSEGFDGVHVGSLVGRIETEGDADACGNSE